MSSMIKTHICSAENKDGGELMRRPESLIQGEVYHLKTTHLESGKTGWIPVWFLAYPPDPGLCIVRLGGRRKSVARRNLYARMIPAQ